MRISTLLLVSGGAFGVAVLAGCAGSSDASQQPPARSAGDASVTATQVPVVFRLDDVGATACADTLPTIFNVFLESKTPLVLGIVGDKLPNSTGAKNAKSFMDSAQAAGIEYEIASHSNSHKSGGLPGHGNSEEQRKELQAAQDNISVALGVAPKTLVTPENNVNSDTIKAMGLTKPALDNLSAQCTWGEWGYLNCGLNDVQSDVVFPQIVRDGVGYMPAGAVLDDWQIFDKTGSVDIAWWWAERQVDRQGFTVFMLHPQEFYGGAGCPTALDKTKLQVLRDVIAKVRAAGWTATTFQGMRKLAQGMSTPSTTTAGSSGP